MASRQKVQPEWRRKTRRTGCCCERAASVVPELIPCVFEDEEERDPPDEIVGETVEGEGPWEGTGPEGLDHAKGAEDFAEESDEDDGPVACGIGGGDGIAEAVDADDHADALPELRVVRLGHVEPCEQGARKEDGEGTPENVVEAGGEEDVPHPAGRGGGHEK
jgi:hypothetical protein